MNKPELATCEDFDKNIKRVQRHAEVKKIVEAWTLEHTIDELVDALLGAGVPVAPINTIDRVVKDPHIAGAREMFVDVEHPIAGKMKITGSHIKLSETKPSVKTPAPVLGQHNKEFYTEFMGLAEEEIEDMLKEGIL